MFFSPHKVISMLVKYANLINTGPFVQRILLGVGRIRTPVGPLITHDIILEHLIMSKLVIQTLF